MCVCSSNSSQLNSLFFFFFFTPTVQFIKATPMNCCLIHRFELRRRKSNCFFSLNSHSVECFPFKMPCSQHKRFFNSNVSFCNNLNSSACRLCEHTRTLVFEGWKSPCGWSDERERQWKQAIEQTHTTRVPAHVCEHKHTRRSSTL